MNEHIARIVSDVLEANEGLPPTAVLLALGEAATGHRDEWLAEIDAQRPGLLGRRDA